MRLSQFGPQEFRPLAQLASHMSGHERSAPGLWRHGNCEYDLRKCNAVKTKNHLPAKGAFTLVEIMIVVTIICLLAIIAATNFILARDTSRLNVIKRNLRGTEVAREQWAMEDHKPSGAPVVDVSELGDYFRGTNLRQIDHKARKPNSVGTPPIAALPPDTSHRQFGPGTPIPSP